MIQHLHAANIYKTDRHPFNSLFQENLGKPAPER